MYNVFTFETVVNKNYQNCTFKVGEQSFYKIPDINNVIYLLIEI